MRYSINTAAKGFVQLDAGQYTIEDLEEIIKTMKRQNDHARRMAEEMMSALNKQEEK